MSAGLKVIIFQMSAKKMNLKKCRAQMSAGAQRTLKLIGKYSIWRKKCSIKISNTN